MCVRVVCECEWVGECRCVGEKRGETLLPRCVQSTEEGVSHPPISIISYHIHKAMNALRMIIINVPCVPEALKRGVPTDPTPPTPQPRTHMYILSEYSKEERAMHDTYQVCPKHWGLRSSGRQGETVLMYSRCRHHCWSLKGEGSEGRGSG